MLCSRAHLTLHVLHVLHSIVLGERGDTHTHTDRHTHKNENLRHVRLVASCDTALAVVCHSADSVPQGV